MSGQYSNPWKMYLAGVWSNLKGEQVIANFTKLGLPTPQHAFVIKGEGLDSKVLDSQILIFLDSQILIKNIFLGSQVRIVINLPYAHTPVLAPTPGKQTSVAFVSFHTDTECTAVIEALNGHIVAALGPQPLEAIIVRFLDSQILMLLDYQIVRFIGSFCSRFFDSQFLEVGMYEASQ